MSFHICKIESDLINKKFQFSCYCSVSLRPSFDLNLSLSQMQYNLFYYVMLCIRHEPRSSTSLWLCTKTCLFVVGITDENDFGLDM